MAGTDWEIKASGLEIISTRYQRAPVTVADVVEKNLRSVAFKIMDVERKILSVVHYTGNMEDTVSSQYEATPPVYRMTIGPTSKHRDIVRTGTRPHWVPIGPLKEWVRVKLGGAKLITVRHKAPGGMGPTRQYKAQPAKTEDEVTRTAYAIRYAIHLHGTSHWLAQKGIKGAEQTRFGIGYNYPAVTMQSGGIPGQLEKTSKRIPLDVAAFLNTGKTPGSTS